MSDTGIMGAPSSRVNDLKITIPFLFRFGNYVIPLSFIKLDTFEVNPNQRQDLDAYTDANGVTHRNGLAHYKTQIKFTTRRLKSSEFYGLITNITSNYENHHERDAHCVYWDWEYLKMREGHMYLDPSLAIKIGGIVAGAATPLGNITSGGYTGNNFTGGEVRFVNEIEWLFIEY